VSIEEVLPVSSQIALSPTPEVLIDLAGQAERLAELADAYLATVPLAPTPASEAGCMSTCYQAREVARRIANPPVLKGWSKNAVAAYLTLADAFDRLLNHCGWALLKTDELVDYRVELHEDGKLHLYGDPTDSPQPRWAMIGVGPSSPLPTEILNSLRRSAEQLRREGESAAGLRVTTSIDSGPKSHPSLRRFSEKVPLSTEGPTLFPLLEVPPSKRFVIKYLSLHHDGDGALDVELRNGPVTLEWFSVKGTVPPIQISGDDAQLQAVGGHTLVLVFPQVDKPTHGIFALAGTLEPLVIPARQEDLQATKSKRSTERGEGRDKIIAALAKHHQYENGSCLNYEPIVGNELARIAEVGKGTVNRFFNRAFNNGEKGGYAKYKRACRDQGKLVTSLKLLLGEVTPSILFKTSSNVNKLENTDE
jgi:hypothetical protein